MKKVLFLIDTLGYGGAEKVLVNLVNFMDKTKYDITLMTLFDVGTNRQYLSKEVNYKYAFKRLIRGNVLMFKLFKPEILYRHLIKDKYDVVIAFMEGNTTRILSGCTDKGTKKLAWVHIELGIKDMKYPYRNYTECLSCYAKYDKTVCVSQNVADVFKSNTHNNRVQVIYNTVDMEYIDKRSQEPIEDILFRQDVINLISVGRLIEQKSYKRLLSVHKRLLNAECKANLYILGEGEQKKQLTQYIANNNMSDSVFLLGFKDNPWKYVKAADLFVCSSWREGFSTAVSESLIVGTPVITTDCTGMREMLGDNNEYGIIVDNNEDALYEGLYDIINDAVKLKYYKEQTYKRREFFNPRNRVKDVENLIDSLV